VNDVAELKQFVLVHARAQGISSRDCERLLGAIETDDSGADGSWVAEWCLSGARLEEQGKFLDACRRYNMARFPYVDGHARQQALQSCLSAFDRWRHTEDIDALEIDLDGVRVRGWATGLSATTPRPLLLVMGGIISIKEQWAPVLPLARRLGLAGVVAEMPGVGENAARYGQESTRLFSRLIDAVADRADVSRTYAVALSFSGNLAMHAALGDPRIRGIITVGAPVGAFFTDAGWRKNLPRITTDTLAHTCRVPVDDVPDHLRGLALGAERLAALDIPVYYLASRRDEIIPPGDIDLLRRNVRDLRLRENDDVHGSPRHFLETRLWIVRSLLELASTHKPQRVALGALLRVQQARTRLPIPFL
jgi:esterase FrsA